MDTLDWKATLEKLRSLTGQIVAVGVTDKDIDVTVSLLEVYGRLQPDPDERDTFLLIAGQGDVTVTIGVVRLVPRAFDHGEWDGELLTAFVGALMVGVKVVGSE